MRRRVVAVAALLLSVLVPVPVGHAQEAVSRHEPLDVAPTQPATVSIPHPERPVLVSRAANGTTRGGASTSAVFAGPYAAGIQDDLRAAYDLAVAVSPSRCHLTESVLAAIGQVESGNLADRRIDSDHRVVPRILGPMLDGTRYQAVRDTDGGAWDGNRDWDRALGPMQLIPATWRVVAADMDGDGVRDPQDVYDAAGASMLYLCAGGRDLSTSTGLEAAIRAYNHSTDYVQLVLEWKSFFDENFATPIGADAISDLWALAVPSAAAPPRAPASHLPVHARRPTVASAPDGATGAVSGSPPAPTPPAAPSQDPPPGQTPAPPAPDGAAVSPAPTPSVPPPISSPGPTPAPTPGPDPPQEPAPGATTDPPPVPPLDPLCPAPLDPTAVPSPTPVPDPTTPAPDALPPCPAPTAATSEESPVASAP